LSSAFDAGDLLGLVLRRLLLRLDPRLARGEVVVVAAGKLRQLAAIQLHDPPHHPVQEVTIVGDDDERPLPPVEEPLQPADRLEVQVVRGLVQEEQVGRREEKAREGDAHPPAPRQIRERTVEARLGNAEPREDRTGLRLDPVPPQRLEPVAEIAVRRRELRELRIVGAERGHRVLLLLEPLLHEPDLGEPVEHRGQDAPGADGLDLLGQVADPNRPRAMDRSLVLRVLARQDAQDRGFPGAVRSDEPEANPARDHPRQPVEQDARAEPALDAVDVDHRGAVTPAPDPTGRGTGGRSPARSRRSGC
jgi:hypothetical protein